MNKVFNNKKYVLSLLVTVFGLLTLISGTSYAILKGTATSTNEQVIKAGSVELLLTESFTSIDKQVSPMSDVDGLLQEDVYEFNIRNTGSVAADYDLKLVGTENNTITADFIKVGLEVNDKEIGPIKLSNVNSVIDSNVINKNEVIRYKMRIWIDANQENSFTKDSVASLKIVVEAKQSEKTELNQANINVSATEGIYNSKPVIVTINTNTKLNGSAYIEYGKKYSCTIENGVCNINISDFEPGTYTLDTNVSLNSEDYEQPKPIPVTFSVLSS